MRLSKTLTNMPLATDEPVTFGVWEFCKDCKKCADHCPSRAIPFDDEPSWQGPTISNNSGVLKWYVQPERCFRFWLRNGCGCANCLTNCPYNKDYSHWYHRLVREMGPRLGRFAVRADDLLGHGKQASAEKWWRS
jgi:epoxyqueuosine reductase